MEKSINFHLKNEEVELINKKQCRINRNTKNKKRFRKKLLTISPLCNSNEFISELFSKTKTIDKKGIPIHPKPNVLTNIKNTYI